MQRFICIIKHNIDINYCQKYEFSNSSQSGVIIKTFHMMYVQVYYCWSQYYIGPFVEYQILIYDYK